MCGAALPPALFRRAAPHHGERERVRRSSYDVVRERARACAHIARERNSGGTNYLHAPST